MKIKKNRRINQQSDDVSVKNSNKIILNFIMLLFANYHKNKGVCQCHEVNSFERTSKKVKLSYYRPAEAHRPRGG